MFPNKVFYTKKPLTNLQLELNSMVTLTLLFLILSLTHICVCNFNINLGPAHNTRNIKHKNKY